MLTHIDQQGNAQMVDVSEKSATVRVAVASCRVEMSASTFATVMHDQNPKGDVFATVRIAGIQAAKKCSELIPLCHPLMLSSVNIDIEADDATASFTILCTCKIAGKTGVEMEALTGASIAGLTLYDMCKAIDKHIVIAHTKLLEKSGGKSGDWARKDDAPC